MDEWLCFIYLYGWKPNGRINDVPIYILLLSSLQIFGPNPVLEWENNYQVAAWVIFGHNPVLEWCPNMYIIT
jgi:hypothetical protein